jgi:hypothetical protein
MWIVKLKAEYKPISNIDPNEHTEIEHTIHGDCSALELTRAFRYFLLAMSFPESVIDEVFNEED